MGAFGGDGGVRHGAAGGIADLALEMEGGLSGKGEGEAWQKKGCQENRACEGKFRGGHIWVVLVRGQAN